MSRGELRPYFAYGSNMDVGQMCRRCPGARMVRVARLPAHRFIINRRGVASVIPHLRHDVYGLLWCITSANEAVLDDYEGVEEGWYAKTEVRLDTPSSRTTSALIYIACDHTPGVPWFGYIANIVDAAVQLDFPGAYRNELHAWLAAAKPGSPPF
jgi:gamma-glutamylcyclotransferase